MGHTEGSRRAALGELIASERQRRGLTRAELAGLVRRADRTLGTDESQIKRWEKGQEPQPAAVRALAKALGRPLEELTALAGQQADPMPDGGAYELLAVIEGSDIGAGAISDLEGAVLRLRRSYSTTPPAVLAGQIGARLAAYSACCAGA